MAEPLLFLRALGEPPHRVLAYVEHNPVRAGIVAQPAEYEWSSAGVHLGLQPDRLKLIDLAFLVPDGTGRWLANVAELGAAHTGVALSATVYLCRAAL